MAHPAAADSTTGRRRSRSNELERERFLITRYLDPEILNEDAPLRTEFNRLFPYIPPGGNMYRLQNIAPANFLTFLLNQVSNMISPEIINCRDSGWIACNSVVSGLYAKGVTQCNFVMMNLFLSVEITPDDYRDSVMMEITAGFRACAKKEEANVANSRLVRSKYLWIGGVATSFCHIDDYMVIDDAEPVDTIVLTKPLGTLIAARYKYLVSSGRLEAIQDADFNSNVNTAYDLAVRVMRRSNKLAAAIMKRHRARAVIDVNGCSLLHAAQELARLQKRPVFFRLFGLPVIQHTLEIAEYLGIDLKGGHSPELSGGLLICVPFQEVASFQAEYRMASGQSDLGVYPVGKVDSVSPRSGNLAGTVRIVENIDPLTIDQRFLREWND